MATRRFKYRLYPTVEQQTYLAKTFGCVRFVWNEILGRHTKAYEACKSNSTLPKPSADDNTFIKAVTPLKAEFEWLNEVHSTPLQQSAKNLGQAFQRFFKPDKSGKRAGHPQFKKRSNRQSANFTRGTFKLTGDHYHKHKGNVVFTLGKCKEPFKVAWSRALPAPPSSVTITRDPDGRYYASFVCEAPQRLYTGTGIIGVDLGLKDFAICSDGVVIPNPKYSYKAHARLVREQRRLARKQPGSANRNKARVKVARCYSRVANQRRDFHHKVSTQLVRENQAIGIETLKVKNMLKNHKLARSISDVGWGQFVEMLSSKAKASMHVRLVGAASQFPSTQLCCVCLTRPTERITIDIREWVCEHCKTPHDRDLNAAVNLETLARWAIANHPPDPKNRPLLFGSPEDNSRLQGYQNPEMLEWLATLRPALAS